MKILVAGVGNVWLGDDGFGSAVAQRLALEELPDGVRVGDFGIRMHDLRYALEACEAAIVVDVVRRGGAPGTVYLLDPTAEAQRDEPLSSHHSLGSTEVIQWAAARRSSGESPRELWLIGCEPESFGDEDEGRLGLSEPVERAVQGAIAMVRDLVHRLERDGQAEAETTCTSSA